MEIFYYGIVPLVIFYLVLLILRFYFRRKYRSEIGYRNRYRKNYGFIYFYQGKWELSNFFLIKIGRTNNMKQRMSAAKTSNPFGIKLLGCLVVQNDVYAETFIHKKFAKNRINKDNEWFYLTPYLWFYLWCVNDDNVKNKHK